MIRQSLETKMVATLFIMSVTVTRKPRSLTGRRLSTWGPIVRYPLRTWCPSPHAKEGNVPLVLYSSVALLLARLRSLSWMYITSCKFIFVKGISSWSVVPEVVKKNSRIEFTSFQCQFSIIASLCSHLILFVSFTSCPLLPRKTEFAPFFRSTKLP